MSRNLNVKEKLPLRVMGVFTLFLYAFGAFAQEQHTVTLEQCYQLARVNYPLSKQRDLIQRTKEYTIDNLTKGIYPQLAVNGTGTYQSAVTSISIPHFYTTVIPKDQYNLHAEVSQTLSDFGINRQR